MKFLIDAQLPPALAGWLTETGHVAKHVEEIGLRNADDALIWRYTLEQQAVLLTKMKILRRGRSTAHKRRSSFGCGLAIVPIELCAHG